MATIRIPTPLRKLTQGKEEVTVAGGTVGALIAGPRGAVPGHQGAHLRRHRTGAALRQHLRQRRGHPLPQEPRHAGQGHRRGVDRPGDRGRVSTPSMDRDAAHRYARQIALPEIGPEGQARICGARVAVVGDDLAAETAALYLAAAGVGAVIPLRRRPGRRRRAGSTPSLASTRSSGPASTTMPPRAPPRASGRRSWPCAVRPPSSTWSLLRNGRRRRMPALDAPAAGGRASRRRRGGGARRCAGGGRGAAAARRARRRPGRAIRHLRLPLDGGEPLAPGDRRPHEHFTLDPVRRARLRVAEKITDLIGDTPIVQPARRSSATCPASRCGPSASS